MQITITWTMLAIGLTVYFLVKHLYASYLKHTRGCAYNTCCNYQKALNEWERGFRDGKQAIKAKRRANKNRITFPD